MENVKYFDSLDYGVFGFLLLVSALIGVYFAFFAKTKQNTTNEYLLGGKTMGIFPISMSLIASYISGISILGFPAEMYVYGTQMWLAVTSEITVAITMAYIFLPVFYKLQITSSYEYLKLRFNQSVCLLGSCLFLMKQMLYIPIVIYVPALAFNQVTGINIHLITPITCIICIFYTTLGGLKAVVWTDTIQTIVMVGGVSFVMILGAINVGGFGVVWERSMQTGRIDFFNMDFNPTIRHTFWTVTVGNYFQWLASSSVNQAMVQRSLSLPSLKSAYWMLVIYVIGIIGLVSMSCFTGLVIFATFYLCDPITTRTIGKSDQLLPYFVMQIASWVPGLPGVFVSSVFSAALSSMSTGLNSMTGVILQDLIKPMYKKPISDGTASFIMKIIVVLIGAACVGLVFLVEKMGALIQASRSMSAITAGPLLGIFSLGMIFPWANEKGALVGGFSGLALVAWMSLGTQTAMAQGLIHIPEKPVSVEGCNSTYNSINWKNHTIPTTEKDQLFFLYRLSYMYYSFIGTFTTITIGLLISFLTGLNNPQKMNKDLIAPFLHKYIFKENGDMSEKEKHVTNDLTAQELKPLKEDMKSL